MGTISQKLEYLNGTKSSLKTAINNLGGDITNETTFRNYANVLNDIYDNLPKVSDTGTNVSLSPTLKGRLGIVPKGNTLQDGEPTPETPQEIQRATGTQKVVVSGKNLWNVLEELSNTEVTTTDNKNFSFTTSGNVRTYSLKCRNNTSYYLKLNLQAETGGDIYFAFVYSDGTTENVGYATASQAINKDIEKVSNADKTLVGLKVTTYNSSRYSDYTFVEPQIEQGTATPYQPYQEPQEVDIELNNIELNKIGDYEDYIGGTPDNWVLYKNIGKVVLDENSNVSVPEIIISNSKFIWRYINALNMVGSGARDNILSNYYTGKTGVYAQNDLIGAYVNSSNLLNFATLLSTIGATTSSTTTQVLSLLKTWLSTNNVDVLYPLAETQQTPITEEPLVSQLNELYYLMSYNDTTNIDVTGNLPMRITASAIKGE